MKAKKSKYFKKNQLSKITLMVSIILKATSVLFLFGFGFFMLAVFSQVDLNDPELQPDIEQELSELNDIERMQAEFVLNLPNWVWQYAFLTFAILSLIPLIISIFSLVDLNKGNIKRAAILSLVAALILPVNLPYLAASILMFYDK